MSLIFVDCEGHSPAPGLNDTSRFEFGAVEYETGKSFHGKGASPETFKLFLKWLEQFLMPVFVSDNPAYDWQFINYYFHHYLGGNPFGHSARRIGDFYAGLVRDWRNTQEWKRWRVTRHDHNPVNDARGNVEAFRKIMEIAERVEWEPLDRRCKHEHLNMDGICWSCGEDRRGSIGSIGA